VGDFGLRQRRSISEISKIKIIDKNQTTLAGDPGNGDTPANEKRRSLGRLSPRPCALLLVLAFP
jgi:hypothetical protein